MAARMGASPVVSRNSACSTTPNDGSTWHDHWKSSCSNGRVPGQTGTANCTVSKSR